MAEPNTNMNMDMELSLPTNLQPMNHLHAKVLELIQAQLLHYNLTPSNLPSAQPSNELEDLVFQVYDTFTQPHLSTPTYEHPEEPTEQDDIPDRKKIQNQIAAQVITTHKAKTHTKRWRHDGKKVAAGMRKDLLKSQSRDK